MRQTGNTRKEKAVLCLSYFYENQSYYRLSSVSEPEVSPVILLNQSEVFKHDLSCFFIRNIQDFLFNQPVSDCCRFRRGIVCQIFFQCHQGIWVAAVLDLSTFTQRHEAVTGTAFPVTGSTEAGDIIHFHKPADDFIQCPGVADVKLFRFFIFRFRLAVTTDAGT